MGAAVVTIFSEELDDVTEQMRNVQEDIEKCRSDIRAGQEEIKVLEVQRKCAVYDDEQAMRRLEVLSSYLLRLGRPSQALSNKMKKLNEERERTAQVRRLVDASMEGAREDLHRRQTRLAVLEQDYGELQRQWSELSEMISRERANVAV